jgi:hypothetical protein
MALRPQLLPETTKILINSIKFLVPLEFGKLRGPHAARGPRV